MELLYLNDINMARLTVENLCDVFTHIFELEYCTFYNKNVLAWKGYLYTAEERMGGEDGGRCQCQRWFSNGKKKKKKKQKTEKREYFPPFCVKTMLFWSWHLIDMSTMDIDVRVCSKGKASIQCIGQYTM